MRLCIVDLVISLAVDRICKFARKKIIHSTHLHNKNLTKLVFHKWLKVGSDQIDNTISVYLLEIIVYIIMLHCLRLQNKNCSSARFTWQCRTILEHHTNQLHSTAASSLYNSIHSRSEIFANAINEAGDNNAPGKYESIALPSKAQTVICGGGIMGAAVAYHLALHGSGHEVVLLEQDRFVSGFFLHSIKLNVIRNSMMIL